MRLLFHKIIIKDCFSQWSAWGTRRFCLDFISEEGKKVSVTIYPRKHLHRKETFCEFEVGFVYLTHTVNLSAKDIKNKEHITFYLDEVLPKIEERIQNNFEFSFSEDEKEYIKEFVYQSYREEIKKENEVDY